MLVAIGIYRKSRYQSAKSLEALHYKNLRLAIIDKFYVLGLFNNPSLLWEPTTYVICTCLMNQEYD